ncbi:hypothetical protein [uncultured Muribaculum sp.]|nr:hypothetical protein [uncultured Muribaculum sp.]
MFSDAYGLTEAVLSGRKTQTRRIVKRNQLFKRDPDGMWTDDEKKAWEKSGISESDFHSEEDMHNAFEWLKPHAPYKIGEVVAVAQSYKDVVERLAKKAYDVAEWMDDHNITKNMAGWLNKMFVKASLMIFKIRITNVHVERLNEISDADCIKEGIYKDECSPYFNGYAFEISKDQLGNVLAKKWYKTPREAYAALINRISGRGVWDSNPYVFVYDFEPVK